MSEKEIPWERFDEIMRNRARGEGPGGRLTYHDEWNDLLLWGKQRDAEVQRLQKMVAEHHRFSLVAPGINCWTVRGKLKSTACDDCKAVAAREEQG